MVKCWNRLLLHGSIFMQHLIQELHPWRCLRHISMLTWHHAAHRTHPYATFLVESVGHKGLGLLGLFVDLVSLVDVVLRLYHFDLAQGGHLAHGLHVFQARVLLLDFLQLLVYDFFFNFFLNKVILVDTVFNRQVFLLIYNSGVLGQLGG